MLSLLHIENIAVIQSAEISFGRGFNVLTGETGAGKSIVIDAIGAAIGARTSRDLIRTGAKKARVTAVFCELPELAWFDETGIRPDENGELILERELHPEGKNVCRVAGHIVPLAQLKALGCQLLNIHGQHDGQQLLDERCHLDYLDRFGETSCERQSFAHAYSEVVRLRQELNGLQMNESEKARRMDILNFQIQELERAELISGEEEALLTRRGLLRSAEKLMDAVERARLALAGGDDSNGAASLVNEAEYALSSVASLSEDCAQLSETASEICAAVDDLADRVRTLQDSFDFAPDELDRVESRLDVLYRLKKKYGSTVDEMLNYLERCRQELDDIEFSSEKSQQLEQALEAAKEKAKEEGQKLSKLRRAVSEQLAKRIQLELTQLDMPKVCFQVDFAPKGGEKDGMDATGMDEVRFLMSANIGEALKPINKIASGGELARIMLALKNVLAETDDVSTLVFDEVDTGVSGRAAQKVAEKLFSVAKNKQVLCVTHLPQLAAMGDIHFSVEKRESSGRTFTAVEELDETRRKEELARLTGGSNVTATMLESAGELLCAAKHFKEM